MFHMENGVLHKEKDMMSKVKYLYMIRNHICDCALHQKNDSYNMKISDPLKLCAIIDTNNQNIYFMDFDFNWGFVLTPDQRLPARSMLFSETSFTYSMYLLKSND